jgi:hypothetical protein
MASFNFTFAVTAVALMNASPYVSITVNEEGGVCNIDMLFLVLISCLSNQCKPNKRKMVKNIMRFTLVKHVDALPM